MTVITDIFGHQLEPGDIFVYCPGSKRSASLRVGIYIGTFINNNDLEKVKIRLVTQRGLESAMSSIKPDIFSERCALVSNPHFHIGSTIMNNAIKSIDVLIESGDLPSDCLDRNPE
jgi:hypothetical protein